ncbi:MAG TPA: hypothetical protein VMG59_07360 [Phycisphaerae bacterium]|nr:hypothetical protein [Phycisphaerae bacterium]
MKQLKLRQKCLLDVSGELNHAAQEKLSDYVEKYPDAKIEYEVIHGRYKLLRSLPQSTESVDQANLDRMLQSAKLAVGQELDKKERQFFRERLKSARYRFVLVASGMAAGMAAGLLLVFGLSFMNNQSQSRQATLVDAENTFNELAESKLPMQSDDALNDLAHRIETLQKSPSVESSIGNAQLMTLLDALDQVSDNPQQDDGNGQFEQ